MDSLENPVFARHVMRLGRHGSERRASQHIFTATRANEIHEVRMAIGKLPDLYTVPGVACDSPCEPSAQPGNIKFLARTNRRNIRG